MCRCLTLSVVVHFPVPLIASVVTSSRIDEDNPIFTWAESVLDHHPNSNRLTAFANESGGAAIEIHRTESVPAHASNPIASSDVQQGNVRKKRVEFDVPNPNNVPERKSKYQLPPAKSRDHATVVTFDQSDSGKTRVGTESVLKVRYGENRGDTDGIISLNQLVRPNWFAPPLSTSSDLNQRLQAASSSGNLESQPRAAASSGSLEQQPRLATSNGPGNAANQALTPYDIIKFFEADPGSNSDYMYESDLLQSYLGKHKAFCLGRNPLRPIEAEIRGERKWMCCGPSTATRLGYVKCMGQDLGTACTQRWRSDDDDSGPAVLTLSHAMLTTLASDELARHAFRPWHYGSMCKEGLKCIMGKGTARCQKSIVSRVREAIKRSVQ
jgi:hypothetical protein